jgi:putative nucleotidyltransferase with HDIG domain
MLNSQQLLNRFQAIKTLPHVAIRLSKMIADDSTPIAEFEEVIRLDPTLVMRLLKMVNSPYYGLRQKVDTISRAVVYIGMKTLRNMVVLEALKDIVKTSAKKGLFSRNQLWLHSAAVGICSQMIAERVFTQKGEDAFLCGLLHDIGIILEDQVEPDLFARVCSDWQAESGPFVENEKKILGATHCETGYLLSQDWNFPLEIQRAIRHHHDSPLEVTPSTLIGIIHMAEYFAAKLDYTEMDGMVGELAPVMSQHIKENISEYKALVQDLPEEMAKAEELYKI